jgi:hypothetical protein
VAQGLIADQFLQAIDTKFGARIAPVSMGEIIGLAHQFQGVRPGQAPRLTLGSPA